VQALRRLICLCNACHLSTHLGFANVTGRADQALTHLCAVTGMSGDEVSHHVHAVGELWTRRSQRAWTVDLSILTNAGVTPARPEPAAARPAAAERALRQAQTPAPIRAPPPTPEVRPALHSQPSPDPEPARRGLWTRITGRS